MKKQLYVLTGLIVLASMILAACGPSATQGPSTGGESSSSAAPAGKTQIRWFVGLGTGTQPDQIAVQEEVVADFNASQDEIELVLEVVPFEAAKDTLATQIAAGAGPDLIGPVGWGGSNAFFGQWLDIGPYIESSGFDTSVFDPALVEFYQTEEGQVGLPFAVFPAATYFVPAMFDEAGLNYPPRTYGENYVMPDGSEVEWNWETLATVARLLTVDVNGVNSTEAGFDRDNVVQFGYNNQWQTDLFYIPTYIAGAAPEYSGTEKGSYESTIPDSWKEALKWYYDAMWGEQPFIATGPLQAAPEFGNGNLFNFGKAAMAITPIWYTCCLSDFAAAGLEFQAGALPVGADGQPHGRVDADTYRIWKGTQHPAEAFTVLSYLITTGADKLTLAYGALPAIEAKQEAFFAGKTEQYPFVDAETWAVFKAGLAYPDNPSAEQYQPNWAEAWPREVTFGNLLQNTPPDQLDFDAEWQKLVDDLNIIYNK